MSDPMQDWILALQQQYAAGNAAPNAIGPGNSPQLAAVTQGLGGQPSDAQAAFNGLANNINSGTPGQPPDPNAPSPDESMQVLADHKYPPQPKPIPRGMEDNSPMGGVAAQHNPFQFGQHQHVIGQPDAIVGGPDASDASGDKKKKRDLSALLPLLKLALAGPDHHQQIPYGGGVQPGHGGAINPSIPVLASLPLPGVNLRERLNGKTRT